MKRADFCLVAWVAAGATLALVALAGCQSRIEKVDALERAATVSDRALVAEAQKEVAGIKESLITAPPSRPVTVAKDAAARADALLAQANGPLSAEVLAQRLAIVAGQLSEVESERTAANASLAAERKTAAALSAENAAIKAELAAARDNLRAWAVERDETAKKWERLWFWIWVAAGVYAACIILPIIASVFSGGAAAPILGLASKVFGYIVSPAIQFAKDRAVGGLQRVGQALEDFRQDAPAMAASVTRKFDSYTDADHQAVIGAAAREYKAALPPPQHKQQ